MNDERAGNMGVRSSTNNTTSDQPVAQAQSTSWHALTVASAAERLEADLHGLSAAEAARRLARYGRNALPSRPRKSALQRFIAQFDNFLIYILLIAAGVTLLLGHYLDTMVILAVVGINTVIGFVQEGKAEEALDAIRGMISPKASVLRAGHRLTIDASEVVPGDILLLEAGDRVTADVRLIRARNLAIDEAILTGESVPVQKSIEPVTESAPIGDRHAMAYSGTLVTAGQGAGLVVATGPATELGRISELLGEVQQLETPLIRQMNILARQITVIIGIAAVFIFAVALLVRQYPLAEAFMAMVAIAVAAIPEGLPAVMTVTLAIGVERMARRNAIIRRLPAVETLGCVSVICSDKTGTLTRNEMTVTRVVLAGAVLDVGGVGYEPKGGFSRNGEEYAADGDPRLMALARSALLCNDAALRQDGGLWSVDGDPMEGALVTLGLKAGHDRGHLIKEWPRIDAIPFDAAHRYMATLHRSHSGEVFACVKGAPEQILDMCSCEAGPTGERPLDRAYWEGAIAQLAGSGRRVLALASRPFPADKRDLEFGDVDCGLTLEGLVGLIDPPRPEAIASVAECQSAGIAVRMITGDHRDTAGAIARELGLADAHRVATGQDLDGLSDADLQRFALEIGIFARTSPEHKLRLVQALQADGKVVAMTGDGVNDAPALKRADVGVAMGKNGTEAAKEASDMVLADDNFASIVAAVREGRTVYDNLSKVISFILPINGGESIVIATAILLGLTLPILPLQILWVNMVSSVALAITLAFEPTEPNVMRRAPRDPKEPPLTGFLLWRIGLVSVLFAVAAFAMFSWAQARGLPDEVARTMVVNTIVVLEIFYLFSVRFMHGPSATPQGVLGTQAVLIGVSLAVLFQLIFTYVPFMNTLFQSHPLTVYDAIVIIGVGVLLFVILEVEKVVRRVLNSHPS
jgi:magnesium-transporting ATPase (P-type)